jgi:hypothetical protein
MTDDVQFSRLPKEVADRLRQAAEHTEKVLNHNAEICTCGEGRRESHRSDCAVVAEEWWKQRHPPKPNFRENE